MLTPTRELCIQLTQALRAYAERKGIDVVAVFGGDGTTMQAAEGVPSDIVLVVQSLIVLFIAAPPLVRAIFRLPDPNRRRAAKKTKATRNRKEAAA